MSILTFGFYLFLIIFTLVNTGFLLLLGLAYRDVKREEKENKKFFEIVEGIRNDI